MTKSLAVVIMAAGKGTRMKNPDMAKVMYQIHGKPMIDYVVDLALAMDSKITVVVVGWQKATVIEHLATSRKQVMCVEQSPQLGTGHAVMQAEDALKGFDGDVLVLSGDVPLLNITTVRQLVEYHRHQKMAATVLTTVLPDPTGYGRIVRDDAGNVTSIVEHKDADDKSRAIKEINSGIYLFDKSVLFEGLKCITPNNAQKEYYLTDVFDYFWKKKLNVGAIAARDPQEVQGINTFEQLENARSAMGRVGIVRVDKIG